jgi:outer membrane biosynthesis protein TonB
MKKLLFTFAIILVSSFAVFAQKGDEKPPPKPKPPEIVVQPKPKPAPTPKPEKPSLAVFIKQD